MRERLIVIEGGDGAGKETQAKRAVSVLAENYDVKYFDFPGYERSMAGRLVGECLAGKYGDFRHLHPKLASLPYTLDRVDAKDNLITALGDDGIVICNRYTPSNAMYQAAKLTDGRDEFIDWLERFEYREYALPRPAAVIYLHVPYDVSRELVKQKAARAYLGGEQGSVDQHERDEQYQRDVIALYLETAKARPDWRVIECVRHGTLRTIGDIHEEVMSYIYLAV
jgi:dTMP kinase